MLEVPGNPVFWIWPLKDIIMSLNVVISDSILKPIDCRTKQHCTDTAVMITILISMIITPTMTMPLKLTMAMTTPTTTLMMIITIILFYTGCV